jgi:O2-independent ubiquinone biosynthesis accessory factor UbiT
LKLGRIPPPLGALLECLPQYPAGAVLCLVLNLFARNLFAAEELARIAGTTLCMHVRDAHLKLVLRIESTGYSAGSPGAPADVTIAADAREFVLLALGNADPDTLFFDRRLTIEGDTEAGLIVRNALDRAVAPLPEALLRLLRQHFS